MIELTHVNKSYGALLLLKDVSAAFAKGRVYLVTGRNGSGKSTLLRLIGGLSQPDSGTIACSKDDARTGYLGHATFLYPNLTAVENLSFWQKAYGMKSSEEDIMAMLERVGLLPFAHTHAGVFSRGMAQRLSLARVLLLKPDILLLDEPETGLDAASRTLLSREVGLAKDRGACVLWVSHAKAEDRYRADAVFEVAEHNLIERNPDDPSAGEALCSN